MNEARLNVGSPPSINFAGGHCAIATSLFGAAILATVATASQAQVKYVDSIGSIGGMMIPSGTYVVAGGNLALGDGGGGTFMPSGGTICQPDKGIVFQDGSGHCFYRADPTYSVREWGARCDVVSVNAAGAGTWTNGPSGSSMGTLTVPTTLLPTPLTVTAPGTISPLFIAISQIGSPTLWGSSLPAVSLTRFSTLSNRGTGYKPDNVVLFAGGNLLAAGGDRRRCCRRRRSNHPVALPLGRPLQSRQRPADDHVNMYPVDILLLVASDPYKATSALYVAVARASIGFSVSD